MSLLLALTGTTSIDAKVTWVEFNTAAGGGAVNYTLTCAAGAYAYTGTAANLKTARALSLAAGAYNYAGVASNLKTSRFVSLAAGSYVYAGQAAIIGAGRVLPLSAGAYNYTGTSANLKTDRHLQLAAGVYNYSGEDATLTYTAGSATVNYTLDLAAGTYSYTGLPAKAILEVDMIVGATPAEVWDEVLESGYSARQLMRIMTSVLDGKVSGAGTGTESFRDLADTKNRVVSTVDSNGNRTSVVIDAS
jgi:hypothetical protein